MHAPIKTSCNVRSRKYPIGSDSFVIEIDDIVGILFCFVAGVVVGTSALAAECWHFKTSQRNLVHSVDIRTAFETIAAIATTSAATSSNCVDSHDTGNSQAGCDVTLPGTVDDSDVDVDDRNRQRVVSSAQNPDGITKEVYSVRVTECRRPEEYALDIL